MYPRKHFRTFAPVLLPIFALLPLTAPQSLAGEGGSVGNGGNARVCFKGHPEIARRLTDGSRGVVAKMIPDEDLPFITSVETLDLVEAGRSMGPERVQPSLVSVLPGEKAHEFAIRLARPFGNFRTCFQYQQWRDCSTLTEILRSGIDAIGNRVYFSPDSRVFPVDDIQPIAAAGNSCVFTTVAVQRSVGGTKRELVIDGRLYDRMDRDLSRAMLYTHEYYLAAFARAVEAVGNTDSLREFTAALVRKDSSLGDLLEIIARRGLNYDGRSAAVVEPIEATEILTVLHTFELQRLEIHRKLTADETLATDLRKATATAYAELPRWYTTQAPLPVLQHWKLQSCVYSTHKNRQTRRTSTRCLNARELMQLANVQKIYDRWVETHLQPALREELAVGQSSRQSRFESALMKLLLTGVIPEKMTQELRDTLADWVRDGELTHAIDFGSESISVQLSPSGTDANVNDRIFLQSGRISAHVQSRAE